MGNHLKRQAGVADVSYKAGTIEIRAEPAGAFEISSILRTLRDDIGVSPIKTIDATIPGRIVRTVIGRVLEVAGTGERLLLKDAATVAEGERVLKGSVEVAPDGTLTFRGASKR